MDQDFELLTCQFPLPTPPLSDPFILNPMWDLKSLPYLIMMILFLCLFSCLFCRKKTLNVTIKHHHRPIHVQDPLNQSMIPLHQLVKENCPSLNKFIPTPWLWGGHSQTIYASLFVKSPCFPMERELIQTTDGGLVSLDWAMSKPLQSCPLKVLLILPGLAGGSSDSYIQDLVRKCQGPFQCVVFNYRGCEGTPVQTPKLFCASFTQDLSLVIETVKLSFPESGVYACGFSLGANILVKYAGETGKDCPLVGLVSIANPFDLTAVDEHLHSCRNLYSKRFARNLILLLKQHWYVFAQEKIYDESKIFSCSTIREFDSQFTSLCFGFESVDDYYFTSSCYKYIGTIRRPLLCLNAWNDPIVPGSTLPLSCILSNPWIILCLSKDGGHLGWLQGWMIPKRWFPDPVLEYLLALSPLPPPKKESSKPLDPLPPSHNAPPLVKWRFDFFIFLASCLFSFLFCKKK